MLVIDARPGERTFSGQLFIHGVKTGKFVRLHSKSLAITNCKVNCVDAKVIELDNDEIELRPVKAQKLDPESAAGYRRQWGETCDTSIGIEFTGQITEGAMHGLYPCFYEVNGERHELLATQFESHHAREVFPCVDEPAAKAKFHLQVRTSPEFTVLSNMPTEIEDFTSESDHHVVKNLYHPELVKKQPPSDLTKFDWKRVAFQMAPKMSTYLLAFVIGDLHKKSATTKRGVEVNVYATPPQPPKSLDFALDTAVRTIDWFEKYFGVNYPLPKSDHVALPDFSSGAMENWGLVTYREEGLLIDKHSAFSTKQTVATYITHELSHQWFGNLVTMKWWDDLWLNESFASFMEHMAPAALFPNWDMWMEFETGRAISALRRDCLPGVQPIRQNVHHPDEISTLFDGAIVYAKGEFLLRMMHELIGDKAFHAGLKDYFKKFAYGNTAADDLWQCLASSSGQDISKLMNPWLTQPGYPVVIASTDGTKITLRQQRFLSTGESDDTIWPIPLFASDKNAPDILDQREVAFKPDDLDNFRLNVGNKAYFITVYDETLSADLRRNIPKLPAVDRLKFLNELMLLTRAGLANTATIIDTLEAYAYEDNYAVWDIMSLAIADLKQFVEPDSDDEKRLKHFVGHLAEKQFKRLGLVRPKSETDEHQHLLRATVAAHTIYSENRVAIDKALAIYAKHKHDLAAIDGELRPIILATAVRWGDTDEFDYLLSEYKRLQNADLKYNICSALTATRDQDNIDQILGLLTKINFIKPQETARWFVGLLRNRHATDKAWSWMVENWDWITRTFGGGMSCDDFPVYAGMILRTRYQLEQYKAFFAPLADEPSLSRAIKVGLNDITARMKWIERDRNMILKKLQEIQI